MLALYQMLNLQYLCKNGHSKIDKANILMTNGSLMKVKSIAECSKGSILQYFWPAFRDNWSWNQFLVFLSVFFFYTCFTVMIL